MAQPARRTGSAVLLALLALWCGLATAQVNVTMRQNDVGRTGQNLSETALNTTTVGNSSFGKLFQQSVDGFIYTQPLYLSGVAINGASHNVVYVTTQHGSVYAFDADDSIGTNAAPLWQTSLIPSAASTIAQAPGADIVPEYAITGTPVIDPNAGTLFVVAADYENGTEVHRLHALDLTTGLERANSPVQISASVPGSGAGSAGGVLQLQPSLENNRSGLLLLNGIVYIGYASHEDLGNWHGWILGYDATSLQQTGVWCSTPNGIAAGVWMGAAGLAADAQANAPWGRMFIATGNGDFDSAAQNYGESHLALNLTNGTPTVVDSFTDRNWLTYNQGDTDVGSGGVLVLPDQPGAHPHLMVQIGKAGILYLLDRDNLGGYNPASDQALQEVTGLPGAWSSPAYWNGTIYTAVQNDNLRAFALTNAHLAQTGTSPNAYGYPGATPVISANGTTAGTGIVWTLDSGGYTSNAPMILLAHDAADVTHEIWSSNTNPLRDQAGPSVKFQVPTVANGKVYVGSGGQLNVYGLLSGRTQASVPVITPPGATFIGTQSVSIADADPSATIYYTLDGSTPTAIPAHLYNGTALQLQASATVKAIAVSSGLAPSSVQSATFTLTPSTAPVFTPAGGNYATTQTVTLTAAGATIYYTTDGSTPTTSSTRYSAPIVISHSMTVNAIAVLPNHGASAIATAVYTIGLSTPAAPTISPAGGSFASPQTVTLSAASGATIYYTLDGTTPSTASPIYRAPLTLSATSVIQAVAIALGSQTPSSVSVASFSITPNASGHIDDSAGFAAGLTLQSPAAVVGGRLRLTDDGLSEATSAWSAQPLNVANGFSTDFTFQITSSVPTPADGFTFALQNSSATAVGPSGGGLGYGPDAPGVPPPAGSQSIPNSVAIKFDLYPNAGEGSDSTGLYLDGASPTTPSVDLSASGINLASGHVIAAHLTYDGATLVMTLRDTDTGAMFTQSWPLDLATALGGSTAYVGFTAGTGGFSAVQDVLTWSFTAGAPPAPAPSISPGSNVYATAQTVSITDSAAGATIHYTLDGSTPTAASSVYSAPITISSTRTLKAIATAQGYASSSVAAATYTIGAAQTATPVIAPAGGIYSAPPQVTLSDATAGAIIYYTLDGSMPTTASSTYHAPLTLTSTGTVKAIARAPGLATSAVASATYTIKPATAAMPTFSPAGGTYNVGQLVSISTSTPGAQIYYTLDGSQPTTSAARYGGPVSISSTQTLKAIAVASGYQTSATATASYNIVRLGSGSVGGGGSMDPGTLAVLALLMLATVRSRRTNRA